MPSCYYYDEQRNRCNCYVNENLNELLAENAKLRDELANAPKCEACEAMLDCDECLRADGSHKERRRLSAENAKLRELVLHMVECVRRLDGTSDDGGCSLCPYQSIDYDCEFENRARDLGVEVDG